MAVHPGSQGLLAVTAGLDRSVAVLDLAKGRLLTKWKYNSRRALAGAAVEPAAEAEGERDAKRVRVDPAARALAAREEPVGVLFSPAGTRLAVYSRVSCVVYDATTMAAVDGFVMERPQPSQELGCALFVAEDRLLFGDEAGAIRLFEVRAPGVGPLAGPGPLPTALRVRYPPALQERAQQLLAAAVDVAAETRLKNPLRHTSRIKALCLQPGASTVFSIDANGVVLALRLDAARGGELEYLTSGNCRGRVTCMDILSL
ncbi:hypothetical protein STCU_00810 [Strigomonas culicis]|uniref:Uncharacterized protein n=1 Tax=Strigomonas culicis TaxID=28005 RepID=S9V4L5_9TRYP|nr:hypothetical protein STCU_08838 [Strigomonas culicis]EPY35989.1 hypothetical protein STCU_00810 [Strigomonas culicis]|eukprot:EPY20781.1 hypothetical protein STCU_08838 [Strigomonas culicis]